MGLCSSVHRNQETTNMKHHLSLSFGSKTDKLVIPPSPIKDKPKNGNFLLDDLALKSHTFTVTDYGSKEEAFFDSKNWLDSDCEDDFYSVKGDFTPSRGSTPLHHTFGTPIVKTPSENITPGSVVPETSPTEKKKKLLELFRESVREDKNDDVGNTSGNEKKEVKPTIHELLPKSAHSTPYISGGNSACSSERTMNDDHASIREKSVKSVQRCLPSLASCRSFSERRRKTSPAIAANGKA
ncbi:uncharacterized protein At3g27210-like isoform X2 [Gastrolobium bilobum]|uniref:uncharacterized protein At3g27210-like isoform X2 n=1 Tax=Gastrolobium bilobum TaxID=150636 RepID=UPI002AAF4784|nr:uncharacterized protein At3g27210-like isoform X2 [Gastrolobium bilobum]